MHDLSLNLFYKTSFDIECAEPDKDALWELVLCIRSWMRGKWTKRDVIIEDNLAEWTKFKNGRPAKLGDADGIVRFDSAAFWVGDGGARWACSIEESFSESGHATRHWVTEIGFSSEKKARGCVSIVLSYGDRPGYLGPVQEEPQASVPNIVKTLNSCKKLNCTTSGREMPLEPRKLEEGDFASFWDFTSNPSRETPVVFVSSVAREDGRAELLVDPLSLSRVLGPSAFVFYSTDSAFYETMRGGAVVANLSCTGGAVRVYAEHPRFSESDDSRRHRYFSPKEIGRAGAGAVVSMIRRALAQDVDFYESMTRVGTVRERLRRQRIEDFTKKAAEKKLEQSTEEALKEMIEQEEALQELADRNADLESEIGGLKRSLRNEEAARAVLQKALESKPATVLGIGLGKWPISPEQIASLFCAAYPDRIDFTDRGRKSLKECHTRAEILWNALYDLVTIAYDLYCKKSPNTEKEFNDKSKFSFSSHAGSTTMKDHRLAAQYRDTYQGRPLKCEAHIKNKNTESNQDFIRIYFDFEEVSRKIVVSSCGKHLDTYSTRKIH